MSEFVDQAAAEITGAPEPAPAPEPTPTPEATPAPQHPAEPPDQGWARSALREERDKRQGLERQMGELQKQLEELRKPPSPVDQPPDKDADPLGWVEWHGKRFERSEQERQQREVAERTANERQQQTQRFLGDYRARAEAFAQQEPTFVEGYNYLRDHRGRELAAFGISDPGHREQVLVQEEFNLVQAAIANGIDPASALFQAAKLRGFQGTAGNGSETASDVPRDPATGQFRSAAPPPKPPRSLSHAPGSPGGQLTGAALLNMSGDEFDRVFHSGRGWRQAHGR